MSLSPEQSAVGICIDDDTWSDDTSRVSFVNVMDTDFVQSYLEQKTTELFSQKKLDEDAEAELECDYNEDEDDPYDYLASKGHSVEKIDREFINSSGDTYCDWIREMCINPVERRCYLGEDGEPIVEDAEPDEEPGEEEDARPFRPFIPVEPEEPVKPELPKWSKFDVYHIKGRKVKMVYVDELIKIDKKVKLLEKTCRAYEDFVERISHISKVAEHNPDKLYRHLEYLTHITDVD